VGPVERAGRWCRRNPGIAGLAAALGLVLVAVAVGSSWAAYRYSALAKRERRTATAEASARARADRLAQQERVTAAAEKYARGEADRLRAVAESKTAESQQRLVSRLVSEGARPLEEGDLLAALPWFAEGLTTDAGHPRREPLHRLRLATTLRYAPRLVHALFLPATPEATTFAPDGRTIITADQEQVVTIDMATGQRQAVALDLAPPINGFRTTPDGRFAIWVVARAAGGPNRFVSDVHVWDVPGRQPVGPPIQLEGVIEDLQLGADGRRVSVVPQGRRSIRSIDPATGREAAPAITTDIPVSRVRLGGDGRRLVVECLRQTRLQTEFSTQVWDAAAGRPLSPPLSHPSPLNQAELSADGSRLLTVNVMTPSAQGAARVWGVPEGTLVAGPFDHGEITRGQVIQAALSLDGEFLATAGFNDARIWDLKRGKLVGQPLVHGGLIGQVGYSPDGRLLATLGSRDGTVRVWDTLTRMPVLPVLRQAIGVGKLRFSADGRLLLTLGRDGRTGDAEVRAWDLTRVADRSGAQQALPGRVLARGPGGRHVIVLSGGNAPSFGMPGQKVPPVTLRVHERQSGRPVSPPLEAGDGSRAEVLAASLNDDATRLVAAIDPTRDRRAVQLQAWDVASGHPLGAPLAAPGQVAFVVGSPDGRRAAVLYRSAGPARPDDFTQGFKADAILLWDIERGHCEALPIRAGHVIVFTAFSPDSRRLLTVQPGLARVWDAATGAPVGPEIEDVLPPGTENRLTAAVTARRALVPCAAFRPDGRLLAVSTGTAKVHRIDPEDGAAAGPPLENSAEVTLARFSGDGHRLVLAAIGGFQPRVWDARDGTTIGRPLSLPSYSPLAESGAGRVPRLEDILLNGDGQVAVAIGADDVQIWEVESGLPLSPTIPTPGRINQGWFDDEHHLEMLLGEGQRVWTLDLARDDRPVGEWRRMVWLLSGRRIDDVLGPVGVEPAALRSAWAALRGRSVALPEVPSESAATWHRRVASECETAGRWFAARVHLDAILAATPDDPEPGRSPAETYRRQGEALARLGEWDRAVADFARVVAESPLDVRAHEALVILLAYRGDRPAYQARCATLRRFVGPRPSRSALEWIDLMTLMPGGTDDPAGLIGAADAVAAVTTPGDAAPLATRGRACYRAERFKEAVRNLRESLAAYGRQLQGLQARGLVGAAEGHAIAVYAAAVSPKGNAGTPFDWLFLALAEQRVGHTEAARAWLDEATRWIDQARRDPSHPSVLGGLSDPSSRALVRMMTGFQMRPELGPPGLGGFSPTQPYLPTWRQLLALEVLRREAASLIGDPATANQLPENVFAP
jgi:WD40 repeat protein/tetratricopeptide (TPR) repeat protein